jgi:MoxR-like ATPase
VRIGSSVRGAIDLVLVARSLAELRGSTIGHPEVTKRATMTALSGRIRVDEATDRTPEEILQELWMLHLGGEIGGGDSVGLAAPPRRENATVREGHRPPGKATGPPGPTTR